jgi:hypothetical protein
VGDGVFHKKRGDKREAATLRPRQKVCRRVAAGPAVQSVSLFGGPVATSCNGFLALLQERFRDSAPHPGPEQLGRAIADRQGPLYNPLSSCVVPAC